MKEEIISSLRESVVPLSARFELDLAVLFGSNATGFTHSGSDVDIAILSRRRLSPLELGELATEIQQKFSHGKIDIVDLKTAPPVLLRDVVSQGKLLYENDRDVFDNFRIYALKIFFESAPLRKMREESLKKFIAQTV